MDKSFSLILILPKKKKVDILDCPYFCNLFWCILNVNQAEQKVKPEQDERDPFSQLL